MRGLPVSLVVTFLWSGVPVAPYTGGLDRYGCHRERIKGG